MKKFLLLICVFLSCLTVKAQECYATLTAGCDTYTNFYGDTKFINTVAPTAAIAVGVDINPYIGTRIEVRTGEAVVPYAHKPQFFMGFVDVTNNLTNTICGLNNRIVDVILFGGVGGVCVTDTDNSFALRYGVSCDVYFYRNDRCALFVEPTFNVNNYLVNKKFTSDYILNLSLGLIIKI